MSDSSPEAPSVTRHRSSPRTRAVAAVATAGLLAGGGYWALARPSSGSAQPGAAPPVSLGRLAPVALTTPSDCAQLLARFKRDGRSLVGPYGLNGGPLESFGVASDLVRREAADGVQPPGASVPQAVSADSAATAAGGAAGAPDSSTNVQVAGVDESDTVKTSGDLMVAVVDGKLHITRLAGADTRELATWRPAGGEQVRDLVIDGDTVVVLADSYQFSGVAVDLVAPAVPVDPADGGGDSTSGNSGGTSGSPGASAGSTGPNTGSGGADTSISSPDTVLPVPMPSGPPDTPSDRMMPKVAGAPGVDLYRLDLSDPEKPRPVQKLAIDGVRAGSARLVDGELRLAINADPTGFAWRQGSTAANRKLIQRSTLANWLPSARVTSYDAAGAATTGPRRQLLACDQVSMPSEFSGLSTLAMVSLDLRASDPLGTWRGAGVIAAGGTLYATADHAWLAANRWAQLPMAARGGITSGTSTGVAEVGKEAGSAGVAQPADAIRFAPVPATTQLYRFDTPLRADPRYVAGGQVPGTLLNQFALDEQDGLLRVASTTGDEISTRGSAARVTVLRTVGDELVPVGRLTGLGKGERIMGVRFAGDLGYVVTYRQTDPLFVIDLSDPGHPALRGELKLPGYSAYLHPAGPDRLLGLGQDGTADGSTTGLQLSLFDVSDPDAPTRLDRVKVKGAWSDVESDHHAFTLAGDLALIPYTGSSMGKLPNAERFDAGVVAVRVGATGLTELGVLRPIADGPITYRYDQSDAAKQRIMAATPLRTLVHDGSIYTLTFSGVAVHNSSTLARSVFARF